MCPYLSIFFCRKKFFRSQRCDEFGGHAAYIDRYVASRIIPMLPVFLTPLRAATDISALLIVTCFPAAHTHLRNPAEIGHGCVFCIVPRRLRVSSKTACYDDLCVLTRSARLKGTCLRRNRPLPATMDSGSSWRSCGSIAPSCAAL
jgi:hypothetical protein